MAVVDNDHPAGTDEFSQEVKVDEDVVKDVAAIHERRVDDHALGHQAR